MSVVVWFDGDMSVVVLVPESYFRYLGPDKFWVINYITNLFFSLLFYTYSISVSRRVKGFITLKEIMFVRLERREPKKNQCSRRTICKKNKTRGSLKIPTAFLTTIQLKVLTKYFTKLSHNFPQLGEFISSKWKKLLPTTRLVLGLVCLQNKIKRICGRHGSKPNYCYSVTDERLSIY